MKFPKDPAEIGVTDLGTVMQKQAEAEQRAAADCMICDLYSVIDKHGEPSSDFVVDLVSVLPPRGHAFHKLDTLERTYRRPASLT